jgi:5-methylcytosine-specific restriction endonuclease McrA
MTQRDSVRAKRFRSAIARSKPACKICGRVIDYSLPHTDPKSFVIDHVIPLHKGGADELHNIQAAHRDCNSKKRARIVAPIIRRSGSLD